MQLLIILPPWPGHDLLTSHNLWLVNLEPCTLHSSPPAPLTPTQLVGGGKDYQHKLQRVRTCTSTIGVPNAASNCYLHKGSPFNVYNYTRSANVCEWHPLWVQNWSCHKPQVQFLLRERAISRCQRSCGLGRYRGPDSGWSYDQPFSPADCAGVIVS